MDAETKQIQIKSTFEAFYGEPKTMLQVAVETNILRGNICRFVDTFRREGKIIKVKSGRCPISKHKGVGFYSTHPDYFPTDTEPELFPPKSRAGILR